jgi:hypothetical protein
MEVSGMGMMMGAGEESKMETTGTIVDPSGLTVVSLSKMDPSGMLTKVLSSMASGGGEEGGASGESQPMSVGCKFSDVKLRLADGTEVPAKLIMKEPDLDLAFIMPEKTGEGRKFNYINLADSGTVVVLDDLFTLGRFGKALNFQPAIGKMYVAGVVAKPRLSYAVNDAGDLGVPAFTAAGKLVGICTLKPDVEGGTMAMIMKGIEASRGGRQSIILPAIDVQNAAKQALAHKDDKKEQEGKKDESQEAKKDSKTKKSVK